MLRLRIASEVLSSSSLLMTGRSQLAEPAGVPGKRKKAAPHPKAPA